MIPYVSLACLSDAILYITVSSRVYAIKHVAQLRVHGRVENRIGGRRAPIFSRLLLQRL